MADVEIVGPVERRRKWTPEEKAALMAEVAAEGGRVTPVARRHRISESLLYNWRAAWRAAAAAGTSEMTSFLPLGMVGSGPPLLSAPEPALPSQTTAPASANRAGAIEIALPNGVRVRVETGVDETTLSRVLRSIRGIA